MSPVEPSLERANPPTHLVDDRQGLGRGRGRMADRERAAGGRRTVFAPIVALTTVQTSLYGTFAQGFHDRGRQHHRRGVATVLVNVAGGPALALFVATFVGLALSKRLPIGAGGRGQVTFSMILVVALGPTSGYATSRLLDCAIGGAVGILISLMVPERPGRAGSPAIGSWARGLRESLQDVARPLDRGRPADSGWGEHPFVGRTLSRLRAADQGLTSAAAGAFVSMRFDPRARRHTGRVQDSPMSCPGSVGCRFRWRQSPSESTRCTTGRPHQPRLDRAGPRRVAARRRRTCA